MSISDTLSPMDSPGQLTLSGRHFQPSMASRKGADKSISESSVAVPQKEVPIIAMGGRYPEIRRLSLHRLIDTQFTDRLQKESGGKD